MEEFIDTVIGIKSYLVGGVTGGQGSSGDFSAGSLVKESLLGRGHSWSGPQLTPSGVSWRDLGPAFLHAVGRGRPLRVAASGLRAEPPPGPQQSRKGTCVGLAALPGYRSVRT